jgi:hypothetical protein
MTLATFGHIACIWPQRVCSHAYSALRLLEAGVIKSTPRPFVVQGPDWRLLNELKKELKG